MRISDPYSRTREDCLDPPQGLRATLRQVGPGMILAGSVVGSGELIVTTKLGAMAGFVLLWFVILSCLVKVVVQTELARHTIASGETFLKVFNSLPGPSGRRPAWLTIPWMAGVVLACVVALSVFVRVDSGPDPTLLALWLGGGVLALAVLLAWFQRRPQAVAGSGVPASPSRPRMNWFMWVWLGAMLLIFVNSGAILGGTGQVLELAVPGVFGEGGARYWSILVAVLCGAVLIAGTYASLERVLIILVSTFTLVTVVCTAALRWTEFSISWPEVASGLSLDVPAAVTTPLVLAALAMYAGTGVAFAEMWSYTYWCVEKGYARHVGDPQPGPEWQQRAKGWVRVMYTDAGLTMVVYTASTVCFYLLGAAILHARQLDPDGREALSVLSAIYTEGLGSWAAGLFIVGAFFVLISTVLSGAAGTSRVLADALGVIGLIKVSDYSVRRRFIRIFLAVALALYCVAYWLFENPPQMLLVTSSLIAAVMYPVLGLGTLYLRHRRIPSAIAPGKTVTAWLWICALTLAFVSPAGILLAIAIQAGWIAF